VKTVAVVGAGIGGLSAAIVLAAAGAHVEVLERATRAGGKIRQAKVAGRAIDAGPTVLTMRWALDQVFEAAGTRLDDHVHLTRAVTLARHTWGDGTTLDLYADRARSVEAIGAFAGTREGERYRAFCAHARAIYESVLEPFLRSQRPTPMDMLRESASSGLGIFARIDAHRTMWRALATHFEDVRLRQLFARYATYSGSSPLEAPATLNLIAHVEQDGVFMVEGGMYRLVEALTSLAESMGVAFRFGAEVDKILAPSGRVSGLRLASGEYMNADAVVLNADVAALADGRFGKEAARRVRGVALGDRSSSALTWAVVGRARGRELHRHNVFFSADYEREMRELHDDRVLSRDPTVYVCAQDRSDEPFTSRGDDERFFVIVNAPPLGDRALPSPQEIDACETRAFAAMESRGTILTPTAMSRTTPADFERLFPSTGGALYGRSTHGMGAALARPSARTKTRGLYLAGGSVHPGAGVPMASLSGQLAASALLEDSASTRSFPTVATPGSISMR
jgi:1-hydroxycarotenoid 3,4-desaturase